MTCKQWDIAVIPFPFVDSAKTKPRPVLIISNQEFNQTENHCVAAMITTAATTQWVGDTEIKETEVTGLNSKSFIRLKFFSLDIRFQPKVIGTLSDVDITRFKKNFRQFVF